MTQDKDELYGEEGLVETKSFGKFGVIRGNP
jgi:hypothetical protein